jgi:signal transduction histidine kinase
VGVGETPYFFYRYPAQDKVLGEKVVAGPNASDVISRKLTSAVFETVSPIDHFRRATAESWVGKEPILIILGFDLEKPLSEWKENSALVIFITLLGLLCFIVLNISFLKTNKKTKAYQLQLANSAKMAALGEMAAGIAHEINNPLAIIMVATQSLRRTTLQIKAPEAVMTKINSIEQTVDRIALVIKGLKAIARNTSQDPMGAVEIKTIVNDTLGFCLVPIQSKGINFHVDPIEEKLVILARPAEISQVLVNILNNAADAIAELEEKWIKLSVSVVEDTIEIRITDSGAGISEKVREKIFNPFFSTKTIGAGTGLGLSISFGIIRKHNGKLYYDSASKNTCFVIKLPLLKQSPAIS